MDIYSNLKKSLWRASAKTLEEYFPTSDAKDKGIIFSHSNGLESSSPYVVINILGHTQQGRSQVASSTTEQFELIYQTSYEVTVQFSFIGSTSGDMSSLFSQRMNGGNPFAMEAFRKENLGYMRKSEIRRAPQKRETKWIEAFNQDVVFSYNIRTTQVVDWVESVILENQIIDPSETFTVPPGIPIP